MLSVDEVKQYLRVDSSDDDAFIKDLIPAAESLVRDVGRIPSSKPRLCHESGKPVCGGLFI